MLTDLADRPVGQTNLTFLNFNTGIADSLGDIMRSYGSKQPAFITGFLLDSNTEIANGMLARFGVGKLFCSSLLEVCTTCFK